MENSIRYRCSTAGLSPCLWTYVNHKVLRIQVVRAAEGWDEVRRGGQWGCAVYCSTVLCSETQLYVYVQYLCLYTVTSVSEGSHGSLRFHQWKTVWPGCIVSWRHCSSDSKHYTVSVLWPLTSLCTYGFNKEFLKHGFYSNGFKYFVLFLSPFSVQYNGHCKKTVIFISYIC